jgi:hypothetical protein
MPLPLAPNEHLAGTPEQRRSLHAHLDAIRAEPTPRHMHPQLTLMTLADLRASSLSNLDPDILHAGLTLTARRCSELGLNVLVPPDRTWIGTSSAAPAAFGGFHYPGQGYRHWQMICVITRYGPLATSERPSRSASGHRHAGAVLPPAPARSRPRPGALPAGPRAAAPPASPATAPARTAPGPPGPLPERHRRPRPARPGWTTA